MQNLRGVEGAAPYIYAILIFKFSSLFLPSPSSHDFGMHRISLWDENLSTEALASHKGVGGYAEQEDDAKKDQSAKAGLFVVCQRLVPRLGARVCG